MIEYVQNKGYKMDITSQNLGLNLVTYHNITYD